MNDYQVIYAQNGIVLALMIPLFIANIYYYWLLVVSRLNQKQFHFWMALLLQLCFGFGIVAGATAIAFGKQCEEIDCF